MTRCRALPVCLRMVIAACMVTIFLAVSVSRVHAHDGQFHPPGIEGHPDTDPDETDETDDHEHAESDEYWAELAKDLPAFDVSAARGRMATLPSYIGGEWGPVTTWPHIPVSAAVVPDGSIMTFASNERNSFPGGRPEQTYTAVWDPKTNIIEEIFYEGHDMFCGHPVMLEDGLMMVSGGRKMGNSPWTSTFDFRTGSWSAQENMSYGRWYPTSVALPDGGVFIGNGSGGQNTGEVWDPADGWRTLPGINFSPLSNVGAPEDSMWPWFVVGASGDVEHIGPHHEMHTISTAGNGSMIYSADFDDTWYPNSGAIVSHEAGKFLVYGGNESYTDNSASYNASVVDVNVSPPVVTDIAPLQLNRFYANPVMLPTGEVLVVGGKSNRGRFEDSGTHLEPEVYDPVANTWTLLNPMDVPRNYHSVGLLMQDGRVFVGGGGLCSCAGDHQDVQIYSPPYLFNPDGSLATRPNITAHPELATTNQTIDVVATAGMQKFSFVKLSATTHAVNTDQRFLDLPFLETTSGQYELTLDSNINVMTPGYWMLFAVDAQGVPSEAVMIQIKNPAQPLANLALGQPTAQSSTFASTLDFVSENAVDGNLNGQNIGKSLTHTNNEAGAWWEVDLGDVHFINTMTLWNRTDCCQNRLANFHIFVSDEPFDSQTIAGTQAQTGVGDFAFPGTAGRQTDFTINRTGRYVRVQLVTGVLQLAEVQIFGVTANQMPEVEYIPIQASLLGSNVTYDIVASDPEGEPLNYFMTGLPTGLSFNASAGQISGIPQAVGESTVMLTVSDQTGGTTQTSFKWFVADAPELLISAEFDTSPEGFNYTDDAYRNTSQPAYAVGAYDGAADELIVTLGGVNGGQILNMSGGWQRTFTLATATTVNFNVDYKLTHADQFEPDEFSQVLVSVNGTLLGADGNDYVAQITGNASPGSDDTTEWQPFQTSLALPAGTHTFSVGGYLNKKTTADEFATIQLTSLSVVAEPPSNQNPVITQPNNQSSVDGDDVSLTIVASDPDGDDLIFSANNLPAGLNIDSVTGEISGQVTTPDTHSVSVTAEDGLGGSDTVVFNWVVVTASSIVIDPLQTSPTAVNTVANFAASASGGNGSLTYRWLFGDGSAETNPSASPSATHTYASAGRYNAQVTVSDESGQSVSLIFYQAIHDVLTVDRPTISSQLIYETRTGNDRVWNVNPDNDTVSVFNAVNHTKLAEISVGANPRALAIAPDGRIWVTNRRSATISVIDQSSLTLLTTYAMPYASQPGGIVFAPNGSAAFVTLEARGDVIKLNPTNGLTLATLDVGENPRHLSINSTSDKLYVSRFITPLLPGEDTATVDVSADGGEVLVVNPVAMTFDNTVVLQHSNEPNAEISGSGVPNYLGAPVIDPSGLSAWVPSKQDNITQGALRNGIDLDFDHMVRSIGSQIILSTESEDYSSRVDFDNAGVASAAAFDQYGNYLFVALETNREVAVVDPYIDQELMRIDVAHAPQGVVVSADNQTLYVHNFMSRSVSAIDISTLVNTGALSTNLVATYDAVASEQLASNVLTGKQLFYDAKDTRLAQDSYMSCASCHNDGDGDGRVWDFTQFGEGLRNTISLQGHANQGVVHWTGNFDEIHDFEGQIRAFAGGTGLMSDSNFNSGTVSDPLGDPKAGLSADLDALTAYVLSLDSVGASPHRQSNGALTTDGVSGRDIFLTEGCLSCHSGAELTDSAIDVRHDIGTIKPTSGGRLGGTLDGLDTPTLRGLWNNAPYLHDGSAETLADAVNAHNGVALSTAEMGELVAFLQQLDANEPTPTGDFTCNPGILQEWWDGIPGVLVSDLTSHPAFPTQPTGSNILSSFSTPVKIKNSYGLRLRGYLVAPETGTYTFWMASDDEGELWLSSDAAAANATQIAHVSPWVQPGNYDLYSAQESAEINLIAGERYYVEALMKEWWGGDHLSVAWETPSSARTVITSADLCTLELAGSAPVADLVADNETGTVPLTVNFDATGSSDADGSIVTYDWTFGDGSVATGATVSYTYFNAGVFDVELTVTDDDGRTDTATTLITANLGAVSCAESGLTYDRFDGVFGSTLDKLLDDPRYPDSPTTTDLLVDFEAPSNVDDYYGARAYGFIMPPVTGEYTFWIASDDTSSLRLSSDSNPGNAVEIAYLNAWTPQQQWDWYPEQKSATISLTGGETYFIEALMKENGGGDNLSVAWQIPDGARQLIPSVVLCPAVDNGSPPTAIIGGVIPSSGDAPLSVIFDGSDSFDPDGPLVNYVWDFGDGGSGGGATPAANIYTTPGTYLATLTVTDEDGRMDTTSATVSVTTPGGGVPCNTNGVRYERWNGIWSGNVADLLLDPRYPDSPDTVVSQTNFVVPTNVGDIYGARMRGYLIAPETGLYTFWVASDNEGQLWLSTDTLPSNAVQIAQTNWSPAQDWDYISSQQSVQISLAAGQAYYIEGLHQTSWGGDYYAAAWQTPNGSRELIPSSVLCEFEVAGRGVASASRALGDAYTLPVFASSLIYSTLPTGLHPEAIMMLTADQPLRVELFALLAQYEQMLLVDEMISAEFITDLTAAYNKVYDQASPELQEWLNEHWTRINSEDLNSLSSRDAWVVVNSVVPSSVGLNTQGIVQSAEIWQIALLLLIILTVFVVYRKQKIVKKPN
ncbi:MAG: PKD domain-containing protein [Candidatus Promineifilaceae bacterium]